MHSHQAQTTGVNSHVLHFSLLISPLLSSLFRHHQPSTTSINAMTAASFIQQRHSSPVDERNDYTHSTSAPVTQRIEIEIIEPFSIQHCKQFQFFNLLSSVIILEGSTRNKISPQPGIAVSQLHHNVNMKI